MHGKSQFFITKFSCTFYFIKWTLKKHFQSKIECKFWSVSTIKSVSLSKIFNENEKLKSINRLDNKNQKLTRNWKITKKPFSHFVSFPLKKCIKKALMTKDWKCISTPSWRSKTKHGVQWNNNKCLIALTFKWNNLKTKKNDYLLMKGRQRENKNWIKDKFTLSS